MKRFVTVSRQASLQPVHQKELIKNHLHMKTYVAFHIFYIACNEISLFFVSAK